MSVCLYDLRFEKSGLTNKKGAATTISTSFVTIVGVPLTYGSKVKAYCMSVKNLPVAAEGPYIRGSGPTIQLSSKHLQELVWKIHETLFHCLWLHIMLSRSLLFNGGTPA